MRTSAVVAAAPAARMRMARTAMRIRLAPWSKVVRTRHTKILYKYFLCKPAARHHWSRWRPDTRSATGRCSTASRLPASSVVSPSPTWRRSSARASSGSRWLKSAHADSIRSNSRNSPRSTSTRSSTSSRQSRSGAVDLRPPSPWKAVAEGPENSQPVAPQAPAPRPAASKTRSAGHATRPESEARVFG